MKDDFSEYQESKNIDRKAESVCSQKVDNASSVFERIVNKQASFTDSISADSQNEAKLRELEQLEKNNRIQERLASFKNKENS